MDQYLGACQPAHDQVLVLQTVVFVLFVALSPAGPLKAGEGGPVGLWPEGVHNDGLCALDLTAAERAALAFRLLVRAVTFSASTLRQNRTAGRTENLNAFEVRLKGFPQKMLSVKCYGGGWVDGVVEGAFTGKPACGCRKVYRKACMWL